MTLACYGVLEIVGVIIIIIIIKSLRLRFVSRNRINMVYRSMTFYRQI